MRTRRAPWCDIGCSLRITGCRVPKILSSFFNHSFIFLKFLRLFLSMSIKECDGTMADELSRSNNENDQKRVFFRNSNSNRNDLSRPSQTVFFVPFTVFFLYSFPPETKSWYVPSTRGPFSLLKIISSIQQVNNMNV